MSQTKQAKLLTPAQIDTALLFLETTRYPNRDKVMFLLSVKAGLRAKEIAYLTWSMVQTSEGLLADAIALTNDASKGAKGGRTIPLNRQLREALLTLQPASHSPESFVIQSERGDQMKASSIVLWFERLYDRLGFQGCSSHSGRRTFITNAARKITSVGGSLRDVQQLAGHSSLQTTQRYIEQSSEAQKRLVNLI